MRLFSKITAIALTTATLFVTTAVRAQTVPAKQLMMSIGFDNGLPTGNLTISSEYVIGGTINLEYGITNNLAVTFTSGADHFISKINPATGTKFDSFGVIPVKAGLKLFFVPSFYVAGEAGIAHEETDDNKGNTKFVLEPTLGWANKHWDVGIRYSNMSGQMDPYGFVALRIAYGFNL